MQKHFRIVSLVAAANLLLVLGGCATEDEVKHAQATADQALSTANSAQQSASQAQSTAQAAQQSADRANAGVSALDSRVQTIQSDIDAYKAQQEAKHRGPRG
jgi:hypothetical protein